VQGDRRQGLAELVVQLAGDPAPLGLDLRQRPPAAGRPLLLEAVEHVPEGLREHRHLRRRPGHGPRWPGASGSTPRMSAVSRTSGVTARRRSSRLTDEHDGQAPDQRGHTAVGRLDHQDDARHRQDGGVGDEDPPEQPDVPGRHPPILPHGPGYGAGHGPGRHPASASSGPCVTDLATRALRGSGGSCAAGDLQVPARRPRRAEQDEAGFERWLARQTERTDPAWRSSG
jgi:hypothetical protein